MIFRWERLRRRRSGGRLLRGLTPALLRRRLPATGGDENQRHKEDEGREDPGSGVAQAALLFFLLSRLRRDRRQVHNDNRLQ